MGNPAEIEFLETLRHYQLVASPDSSGVSERSVNSVTAVSTRGDNSIQESGTSDRDAADGSWIGHSRPTRPVSLTVSGNTKKKTILYSAKK